MGMKAKTSSAILARLVRWLRGEELLLLMFVVLVLLLLTLTPLAFDRAIGPHREYIENVVQPTRETVRDIESRVTEEVALSRGYLATEDEDLLNDYRRVQEEQRASQERLRRRGAGLEEPVLREQIKTLQMLVSRRHEPVTELARREITPEEFTDRLSARQQLLVATTETIQQVAENLIRLERRERERIRTLRSYQSWTLTALAMLAILAVTATGWLAVRLRRRTREEAALGKLARAMNAAVGVDQMGTGVVEQALTLLNVDGALMERADPVRQEVHIVAAAGRAAGLRQAKTRYPGALTSAQLEHGGAQQFGPEQTQATPTVSLLSEELDGYRVTVFPLISDWGAMGSLVTLREPERPELMESEMRHAEVLADLAALAMRKILLLKRAQTGWERAEHLLTARSELIRGLSHDLRNPLGAILGYAGLLRAGVKGELDPEQGEYLTRIENAGKAMESMIEHLVDVGRSDSVEIPVRQEPVSVHRLVREVAAEHQGKAEQRGLDLVVEAPPDLPNITSDPVHIRTVLGNLLSNAVKYTSDGVIRVRAEPDENGRASGNGRWVRIKVQDTGPGIPAEEQEAVFEEFSRLHAEVAAGDGIGLASSRRVATRLGGSLELESEPGRGSTFVLSLPLGRGEGSKDRRPHRA